MQPLSTYSSLLTQNNIMINTTLLTTKLSNELSTGKRALDLADNPDRLTVLDLTQTKNDKSSFLKSCTLGQITTSQYTVSLQHIEKVATTALKSVQDLMSASKGRPSPSGSTIPTEQDMLNQYSALSNTITQALADMTISLNEQSSSGGGYLYSGLRNPSGIPTYSVPPVRDLTTLPYFLGDVAEIPANTTLPQWPPAPATAVVPPTGPLAGPPFTAAVDPITTATATVPPQPGQEGLDLPTYDSDYAKADPAPPLPTLLSMAWGTQKLTIDTNETVNLNINSTDPTFQTLINGLRAAKTAADQAGTYSTDVRDLYMNKAFSYLTKALNGGPDPNSGHWIGGIRGLEQKNSLTELAIQTKSDLHTTDLNLINQRLDLLVGVDSTTVTVQLATANNQLQAAYKVTASLLSMSLINYLK